MYVVSYRYRVPPESEAAYVALQKRVAEIYLRAGGLRYTVLKPIASNDEWMELTFFTGRQTFEQVEQELLRSGVLNALFKEFLALTGLNEKDLVQIEYETAVEERK